MPVLLKATLSRGTGSRATLPSIVSEARKSVADANGPRYLSAVGRQSTTASNASHKSVVSANGGIVMPPITPHRTVLQKIKWIYRHYHLNYLTPLLVVMFYMLIGAFLFLWLEGGIDRAKKQDDYDNYVRERTLLLKRLNEIITDDAAKNGTKRDFFLHEAVDYFEQHVGFSKSNKSDWSLVTALYYSGTLFTTIGYGDVSCVTVWGRIMTVIYAIVGIPLMLITLNDLGKFLFKSINQGIKVWKRKRMVWKKHGKISEVDKIERGELSVTDKLQTQASIEGMTDDNLTVDTAEDELEDKKSPPRMPVSVALVITVGWIFFCAGLFKIWEDKWTYAESCYFMFISLSTIGLGDVAVTRRDLMVLCFAFVIIGLSLVSMCISVIQSALEDLYMKILMRMLTEYQNKLLAGESHTGASMGMMKIWGGNKTAKYLMPLLSKEKRRTAMTKVQDVAEATGMEIPKIFSEIDEKSGMPTVFAVAENVNVLEKEIKQVETEAEPEPKASFVSFVAPPNVILYDSDAQTDNPQLEEKCEQTTEIATANANVGNETDVSDYECTGVQCDRVSIREENTQTATVLTRTDDTMTEAVVYKASDVQTECPGTKEQELQTHLADYLEQDAQTDGPGRWPTVEMVDSEMQTDRRVRTTARSRAVNSFRSMKDLERRKSASASVNVWTDPLVEAEEEEGSDTSAESLDWDPIDGLHAEKQRSVRDLKKFWDVKTNDPPAARPIVAQRSADSPASSRRSKDSPASIKRLKESPTSFKDPKDSPASIKRLKDSSASSKESKDSPASVKRSKDEPAAIKRNKEELTGIKRSKEAKEETTSTKRPKVPKDELAVTKRTKNGKEETGSFKHIRDAKDEAALTKSTKDEPQWAKFKAK